MEETKTKNQHVPTLYGTIIIIIIALTVGMLVWKYEKEKDQTSIQSLNTFQKKVVSRNEDKKNQTLQNNDGKTKLYINKTFGFEFEYPENQVITSSSTDTNISISYSDEGHWKYSIVTKSNSNNLSLEKVMSQILGEPQYKGNHIVVSDIVIDNTPAKKFSINNAHDYGNAGVVVSGKNIIVIYGDDSNPENKSNFEAFIKTFKFNR